MQIEITEATNDTKPIIQNLARFYIYDLSEFQDRKCPDNGLFEDEDYSRYWTTPGNFPYLVICQHELAGFVFVEEGGSSADIDYHIAEFFIVRKFRRKGVARHVHATSFIDSVARGKSWHSFEIFMRDDSGRKPSTTTRKDDIQHHRNFTKPRWKSFDFLTRHNR